MWRQSGFCFAKFTLRLCPLWLQHSGREDSPVQGCWLHRREGWGTGWCLLQRSQLAHLLQGSPRPRSLSPSLLPPGPPPQFPPPQVPSPQVPSPISLHPRSPPPEVLPPWVLMPLGP